MNSRLKRIVCIDDEKDILDLNKKLLEGSDTGYQVTCFTKGADGIEWIKQHKPDLVLLDMMMQGMDGITILKALKADPETRSVPVIFMTTQKTPADVKRYMDLGALSIISKPIDIEDFPFQMEMLLKAIMTK